MDLIVVLFFIYVRVYVGFWEGSSFRLGGRWWVGIVFFIVGRERVFGICGGGELEGVKFWLGMIL